MTSPVVRLEQPSFAGGVVSPSVAARDDLTMYKRSLALCENFLIKPHGGAYNRPGLERICPLRDSTAKGRVYEFEFSTTDTYILLFENQTLRFIRNGGQITETATTITGITNANPGVVTTSAAHGYSNGDWVFIAGVVGMDEVNSLFAIVANVTATTFELTDIDGVNINTSAWGTYTSGGTAAKVYQIATPYVTADLMSLKFSQSADVLTINHPSYDTRELTRTGHTSWTLTTVDFNPTVAAPTNVAGTTNGTPGTTARTYTVTAINEDGTEESLAGTQASEAITGATQANPVVLTITATTLADGDIIAVDGVVGMTELNGRRFRVNNKAANSVELQTVTGTNIDGTGYTAYTSGGTAAKEGDEVTNTQDAEGSIDVTVTWTAVTGAREYYVYRNDNGIYGFIGSTRTTTFNDVGIDADESDTPPDYAEPFFGDDNQSSVATFWQQRRVFANTNNNTQRLWLTQVANIYNLTRHIPARDDDAIIVTMNALKVNAIRWLIPLKDLVVLTAGGEWIVQPTGSSSLTPGTISIDPQGYRGATELEPVVVGDTVIYMQPGEVVRDLSYQFERDSYTGNDLSVLVRHLLDGYTVSDWTFAQSPDSIIWAARSDGLLLGLTYMREQEVLAWHSHPMPNGYVESIASVPETESTGEHVDATYMIVRRVINGTTRRMVERLHTRVFDDIRDAFFVDSGLTLDDPTTVSGFTNADPIVVTATAHPFVAGDIIDIAGVRSGDDEVDAELDTNLNFDGFFIADILANSFSLLHPSPLASITGATQANPVVITAPGHTLTNGEVIGIKDVGGMTEINDRTFTVANVAGDTFELSGEDGTGHTAYAVSAGAVYNAIDSTTWDTYWDGGEARAAVSTVYGAHHLAGETVVGLANGNVFTGVTVGSDGSVALPNPSSRVHLGLAYTATLQSLRLAVGGDNTETIQAKKKKLSKLAVAVQQSRGMFAGFELDNMKEKKWRTDELYGEPTRLRTDIVEITLPPKWDKLGQVYLQQPDPLPLAILAMYPTASVGS